MASVTVMFIDNRNGVQNYSYTLKENDLQRLYIAHAISSGISKVQIAERGVDKIYVQKVTEQLAEDFIGTMKNRLEDMELHNIMEEARLHLSPVKFDRQDHIKSE